MAKQYSPRPKLQIAMEVLRDNKRPSQVAKAYGVHPNSVSKWTKTVLEEGPEIFAKDGTGAEYERRNGELACITKTWSGVLTDKRVSSSRAKFRIIGQTSR